MGFNVGFPSLEEMVFGDSTFTTNENVAFARDCAHVVFESMTLSGLSCNRFDSINYHSDEPEHFPFSHGCW